ncbi:uncharacterized protein TNCV_2564281 [Trichonephila clavipes]|nr:uncharacterized protein TNCV_2564281 [Trichonephila clavipes]
MLCLLHNCSQAWRRLWVRAIIFSPQNRGEPHLILQLCRKAKDEEPLKQVKASRDGLRLFRCSSGSRALRCWAITSGSSLLLYLAADSEKETQDWMYTLREGLWPTVHTSKDDPHEVSLIDDEKSFASGLLGVYGHLVKTSEGVLSIIHPHWQGKQMRWRLQDILDVKLIRKVGGDEGHSGVFTLTVRSTRDETRILQFYSNTATLTVDWIKTLLSGENKDDAKSLSYKHSVASPHTEADTQMTLETTVSYAAVQKTETGTHLQDDTKVDLYGKVNRTSETQLSKIPHAYLNASTNWATMKRTENSDDTENATADSGNDSDESSSDMYDHVYEDLDLLKDSRTYTLYEEIDDDGDYVPPEPPVLPARLPQSSSCQKVIGSEQDFNGSLEKKQKSKVDGESVTADVSLKKSSHSENEISSKPPKVDAPDPRLQKLCESVSEALKLAEEPALTAIPSKRPSILRKVVGKTKTKCHQVSPPVGKARTNVQTPLLKRTVSEPDLADKILNSKDLPLQPFDNKQETKKPARHVPLEEMLKDSKPAYRKQHRRGVSEGGFVYGKPMQFPQIESDKVC